MLPSKQDNPEGLHQRYDIKKIFGNTSNYAQYFVLRIDAQGGDPTHLAACQQAARVYANQIKEHLPQLAADLHRLLDTNEAELRQRLASNGEVGREVTDENLIRLGAQPDPEPKKLYEELADSDDVIACVPCGMHYTREEIVEEFTERRDGYPYCPDCGAQFTGKKPSRLPPGGGTQ